MTVHKMQGSECDLVIMPVYKNNLSKHILYTAFTRAKKAVVLIGTEEELRAGVQRETNQDRESNLLKRLQAQIQHVAFPSPEAEVPEELAGGDEQQALFTAAPAPPVSKVTSPENVSKQGENQP